MRFRKGLRRLLSSLCVGAPFSLVFHLNGGLKMISLFIGQVIAFDASGDPGVVISMVCCGLFEMARTTVAPNSHMTATVNSISQQLSCFILPANHFSM